MELRHKLFFCAVITFLYFVEGKKSWESTRFSSREKSDIFHGLPRNSFSGHEAIAFRTHGGGGLHTRTADAWQFANRRPLGFNG